METRELNKEDRETLELELTNSIKGRLMNMRNGALTVFIGLVLTLIFYFFNIGQFGGKATIISVIVLFYGLFNFTWWFLSSKSNDKFKNDIENGLKNVGQSKILSYNILTKKITMDNGLKIDSFELANNWKKGDQLYIERLPTSNFILKCKNQNER